MRKIWNDLDEKYAKIALYTGITALLTFFAGRFILSLGPVMHTFGTMVSAVAGPLVIGIILMYLLSPAVSWIEGKLQKAFPKMKKARTLSVFLVLIALALFVVILLGAMVGLVTRQISQINFESVMEIVEALQTDYKSLLDDVYKALETAGISIPNVNIGGIIGNMTGFITHAFFGLIFGIYFMIDGKNIGAYWKRAAKKLFSSKVITVMRETASDLDGCFAGYIRGQMMDALIVGVVVTIIFSLLNMPYAVFIGFITGVGNLIPYMGPILGYGLIIIINLMSWNPRMLVIGLVTLAVSMFIDGNIINPRLLAGSIQIHPLLAVASLLAGGAIGGVVGMVVAVPVGAFIRLRFERYLNREK